MCQVFYLYHLLTTSQKVGVCIVHSREDNIEVQVQKFVIVPLVRK